MRPKPSYFSEGYLRMKNEGEITLSVYSGLSEEFTAHLLPRDDVDIVEIHESNHCRVVVVVLIYAKK